MSLKWHTPWTPKEDKIVRLMWGEFGLATISARVGRTMSAVENRARTLGLGGHRHGLVSIRSIAKETGYEFETVARAIETLGLALQVIPATAATQQRARKNKQRQARKGLDEAHLGELVDYLKGRTVGSITVRPGLKRGARGAWGVAGRGPCCKVCGENKRPHSSRGRCDRCDMRARRAAKAQREASATAPGSGSAPGPGAT
jgi:hypothetical protein